MQTASPESIIVSIFETLMDWHVKNVEFQNPKEEDKYGIAFTFDLDCSNHGYEQDGNTHHEEWERRYRKFIHVIVLRPRKCFVAVTEDHPYLKDVPLDLWKNTSNHDSCWRSDGLRVFHKEMHEAWKYCYEHVPKEHQRYPMDNQVSCELSRVFGKPFQFVKVTDEAADDRSSYHRRITSIEPVEHVLKFSG